MFEDDNWDACSGEVFVRKTALIDLAALTMRLARESMENITRDIYDDVSRGYKAKRDGDYKTEYHHNNSARCDAERMENCARDYRTAVEAYVYLRMIDNKGENRNLTLLDEVI